MTKKIYIISIVLMSLIGLFLLSILVTGIVHGNSFFSFGSIDKTEANIRKQEQYDIEDINKISIELVASDLNIILTDDTKLKIIQYSNNDLENDRLFRVINNESTFKVTENSYNIFWWGFNNYSSTYDIYLPKTYNKELVIKTISGDITINDDLNLEQLQITSTSGDMEIYNIKVNNDFKIRTISGSITTGNIEASNVNIETTSGDMEIYGIVADSDIHSVSGRVDLGLMTGSLDLGTTSGDIRINNYDVKKDSNVTSISGEVEISFIPNTNCELQTSSISGDISLPNGSNHIGNTPFNKLTIRTTSGDITLAINKDL